MKIPLSLVIFLVVGLLLLLAFWPSGSPRIPAFAGADALSREEDLVAAAASERSTEGRVGIAPAFRSVRVEVTAATTGDPIPFCSVAWTLGEEEEASGATGIGGSLTISVALDEDVPFSVDQPGYRTQHRICQAGTESVRFALTPVLRGIAIPTGGVDLPNENIVAIAWKAGEHPTLLQVWEGLTSSTGLAISYCRSDGRFEIPVDSIDCQYVVCCGGQGWAMNSPRTVTMSPVDDPVTVNLYPVYGALFTFRTEAGEVPRVSPEISALAGTKTILEGHCDSIHVTSPGLVLAGLDPSWLMDLQRLDRAVFCTTRSLDHYPDPLQIEWNVIGYTPTSAQVPLTFLGNGINHSVIPVQPLSAMDARIVVRAHPTWTSWMDASSLVFGGFRLYLYTPDGQQQGIFVLGGGADDGTMILHDLPRGRFAVTIRDWENEHVNLAPPGKSDVVTHESIQLSGEPVVIDLQHLHYGAVEFDIRTPGGEEFTGPAEISFGQMIPGTETRSSIPFAFKRRPYRIAFANNGTYGALLEQPRYQNVSHKNSYTFYLESGQLTCIVVEYIESDIIK